MDHLPHCQDDGYFSGRSSNWLDQMARHLLAHARRQNSDHLDDLVALHDLIQWGYREGLVISLIPRPVGGTAELLAAKAALLSRLAEVLSGPLYWLPQQAPSWCAEIPPLETPIWLMPAEYLGDERNPTMLRFGFHAAEDFMFFV